MYPDVQSLDFVGPLEVFAAPAADRAHRPHRARVPHHRRQPGRRADRTSGGLRIVPDTSLADAPKRIDTLLVPGGPVRPRPASTRRLLDWIGARPRTRRVTSVCTGAFVLAAAGLLDGRRATPTGRRRPGWPSCTRPWMLTPSAIYVHDGAIWTSAGVTAGMDMALALVEEDLDREAALTIARHLVLFLRRPGNQSQFSATLAAQEPEREPLREVQRYVVENVSEDLTVEALAERAHMSPRNFARAFAAETGITPGRYVERVRLEAARRELEDSSQPIATVAAAAGSARPRRCAVRSCGARTSAPAEYRRRYHPRRRAGRAVAA